MVQSLWLWHCQMNVSMVNSCSKDISSFFNTVAICTCCIDRRLISAWSSLAEDKINPNSSVIIAFTTFQTTELNNSLPISKNKFSTSLNQPWMNLTWPAKLLSYLHIFSRSRTELCWLLLTNKQQLSSQFHSTYWAKQYMYLFDLLQIDDQRW